MPTDCGCGASDPRNAEERRTLIWVFALNAGLAAALLITGLITDPIGPTMIIMAAIAGGVNLWCIKLLQSNHREDVNMRAAWTFSLNDFYSNAGILVAGALVLMLGSNWPDLVIGVVIAMIALKGGIGILRDARSSGPDVEPYSIKENNS